MILEWVTTVGSIVVSWPVVALIAVLLFRKPLLELVDRFTSVKFGNFEIALKEVKERQDLQQAEIGAIRMALKGVLIKREMDHLEGLNESGSYLVRYEPDLYRYLHRLDGLRFIQPKPGYGLMTIEERHKDDEKLPVPPHERPQFDLKEFVYITNDGKKYLKALNDILSKP